MRTPRVRAAMSSVSRSSFAPAATVADAYVDRPIVLKRDRGGLTVSTVSQPTMVVLMLEALDVTPGAHVLEVGTGSGYNAALLSALVEKTGRVTTVELDAELADQARRRLASLGINNVNVVTGDGREGHPDAAPYDRVIVTAGATCVDPNWIEQTIDGGRLVVPLTDRNGQGECVTFVKVGNGLTEAGSIPCGFIPLRGP